MFIISILGKKTLSLNTKDDDFLGLLEETYFCNRSDIKAWLISEQSERALNQLERSGASFQVDLDSLQVKKVFAPIKNIGDLKPSTVDEDGNTIQGAPYTGEDSETMPTFEDLFILEVSQVQ